MKKKLIVAIFLLLIPISFSTNSVGVLTTLTSRATADSYVFEGSNLNHGNKTYLTVGDFLGSKEESYLYFVFKDMPSGYSGASLYLTFYGVNEEIEIIICNTIGSWNEYELTWDNRPEKSTEIGRILVDADGDYTISIIQHVIDKESLSICLYTSELTESNFCYLRSRESYDSIYDIDLVPHIIWEHDPSKKDQQVIPGFHLTLMIGLILIGMGYLTFRVKRKTTI